VYLHHSPEAFRRTGSPFLKNAGGCALVGLMLVLAALWLATNVLAP
jgi:hypothetical protein